MLNFAQLLLLLLLISCKSPSEAQSDSSLKSANQVVKPGAYQCPEYFPLLKNKHLALVINQTSKIGKTMLIDSLLSAGLKVDIIFAPEHGFRGIEDAGAHVQDETDKKTGIPIISLYGNKKKPSSEDLKGIDLIIFDIQDVGVRFYTYISTLHYIMEACAEQNVKLLVLDRPNPLGFYVDGPVLEDAFRSFVGMHPVPIVYGLTIGEYAGMIAGENWLNSKNRCELKVITCKNYDHTVFYELPVPPSPNLRTTRSILLYPSLCLFEGTIISVGRGTDLPFEIYGSPELKLGSYSFVPKPVTGAMDPMYSGRQCFGFNLHGIPLSDLRSKQSINLTYLAEAYKEYGNENFFLKNNFFDKLAGNSKLRNQIIQGCSEESIRNSWAVELNKYKDIRKKYLLYKDFE